MLEIPLIDEKIIKRFGIRYTFWIYRVVGIAILLLINFTAKANNIRPFKRQFFERDPSISYYNLKKDTCGGACLSGCSLGISFFVIFISVIAALRFSCGRREEDRYYKKEDEQYYLRSMFEKWADNMFGLGYSMLTTGIVTNILKLTIARPRPIFFYLCNYKGYYDAVHSGNYTAYYAATNPDKIGDYNDCLNFTNDSVASFPSGHASFSFTCMTFSVMVLQDMLKIKNGFTLWGMLTYSPLIVSAWIALTRVHDFKHHEDDILAGAIIGVVCALLGFHFCSQAYTTNARVKEYESILLIRNPELSNGGKEDLKRFIGNA